MSDALPTAFLARFSFPVGREDGMPKGKTAKSLLGLKEKHRLPSLAELQAAESFAEVSFAWNADGIGIAAEVERPGDAGDFAVDVKRPTEGDRLQVWLDTRDTRNIHRASRFCHQFCIVPAGGGAKETEPIVYALPIMRAREERELPEPSAFRAKRTDTKTGYRLEAWLPKETLVGYEPENSPRIGYCHAIADGERRQFLQLDESFPFHYDPSLWTTLELIEL